MRNNFENTDQLRTRTLGIVFAHASHMRRFMQSETSSTHAAEQIFHASIGADLWGVGMEREGGKNTGHYPDTPTDTTYMLAWAKSTPSGGVV